VAPLAAALSVYANRGTNGRDPLGIALVSGIRNPLKAAGRTLSRDLRSEHLSFSVRRLHQEWPRLPWPSGDLLQCELRGPARRRVLLGDLGGPASSRLRCRASQSPILDSFSDGHFGLYHMNHAVPQFNHV
jgi:hypothetical protein